MRLTTLALIAAVTGACTHHRKQPPHLPSLVGQDVIVEASGRTQEGVVAAGADQELVVRTDDGDISFNLVRELTEVRGGRGALEGLGIGVLAGLGTAILIDVAREDEPCNSDHACFDITGGKIFLGSLGVGALLGIIIGGVRGSRIVYDDF